MLCTAVPISIYTLSVFQRRVLFKKKTRSNGEQNVGAKVVYGFPGEGIY